MYSHEKNQVLNYYYKAQHLQHISTNMQKLICSYGANVHKHCTKKLATIHIEKVTPCTEAAVQKHTDGESNNVHSHTRHQMKLKSIFKNVT